MSFKQNEENLFSIFALKNYYYGKKITVTIEVEDGATWTFAGTIKYTTERLATCQIMKQHLKKLFKRDNDTSFREIKELLPIKNKIERMEKRFSSFCLKLTSFRKVPSCVECQRTHGLFLVYSSGERPFLHRIRIICSVSSK